MSIVLIHILWWKERGRACSSTYTAHTNTHTHTHTQTHTHTHTHTNTNTTHTHNTHTHTHSHTHTLTRWFLWFTGTLHRRNGFYTVQGMCYCPTPTLHLNLALTGDGAFLFSLKKTHSVWFISVLNYGDTENVLINHLHL